MKSGLFILFGCNVWGTRQARLGLGLRLYSRSGIRENVLQFLRIHMTNCTQPPALNDKWQKSTFHPLPSLPLGCTLIFPVKVWWTAQLDVWMWGFIQTHSVQQLEAACRCFMEPTSKSDKNANIIGFCNILIFGSRGLHSGLGDKALKEDQVYFPRHIRSTSVVQGIYGVNCVTPQPMGCPIKASHAVDLPPHITSQPERRIWGLGRVLLSCRVLRWPVLEVEPWGSLSHITAPVKGGLLACWRSHGEYVAFSVNHNADSFLPDCIGGSRDLP